MTKSFGRFTATGVISANPARMAGFYVANTSSGTLVLWDNAAAASGTQIAGTITPSIGWNPFPIDLRNGLYATFGGTLDATFVFE